MSECTNIGGLKVSKLTEIKLRIMDTGKKFGFTFCKMIENVWLYADLHSKLAKIRRNLN
jgi:hypothetical protein